MFLAITNQVSLPLLDLLTSHNACHQRGHAHLCVLSLLLGLEVVVAEVSGSTAEEHESVDADAEAGGVAGRRGGVDGAVVGCLGGRVAGLLGGGSRSVSAYICSQRLANFSVVAAVAARAGGRAFCVYRTKRGRPAETTYLSLQ